MPRTVDLFLDSDQPLDQVAEHLDELARLKFCASPDGSFFVARDGGVVVHLREHDFVDDDELPLSEFRYVLSAAIRSPREPDDSEELKLLRRVNSELQRAGALPSLLVIDLERPDEPVH
jgi:hypothetical protein